MMMRSFRSRQVSSFYTSVVALALISGTAVGISPLKAHADSSSEVDRLALSPNAVEIPQAAQDLLRRFLKEMVATLDHGTDRARDGGYDLVEKYYLAQLGPDYGVKRSLIAASKDLNLETSELKAAYYPKSEQARHDLAMFKAFARENAWRLLVGMIRSIRQMEVDKVGEATLFLDEALRTSLLKNPLSFSIAPKGIVQTIEATGETSYRVGVKLMPELENFGSSVDSFFEIHKKPDGTYHMADLKLQSLGVLQIHFEQLRSLIRRSHRTEDLFSDIMSSSTMVDGLKHFEIDSAKLKTLAKDFLEKEPSVQTPNEFYDGISEGQNSGNEIQMAERSEARPKYQGKHKSKSKQDRSKSPR
jgi:hypothetical protein